jgi:preprotein translocase subunit SecA
LLARVQVQAAETPETFQPAARAPQQMQFLHPSTDAGEPGEEADVAVEQRPIRKQPKVGRNQPCPCGSGKKFKHCHGRLE